MCYDEGECKDRNDNSVCKRLIKVKSLGTENATTIRLDYFDKCMHSF